MQQAKQVLEEYAKSYRWNDADKIELMLRFIQIYAKDTEFYRFLDEEATFQMENDPLNSGAAGEGN